MKEIPCVGSTRQRIVKKMFIVYFKNCSVFDTEKKNKYQDNITVWVWFTVIENSTGFQTEDLKIIAKHVSLPCMFLRSTTSSFSVHIFSALHFTFLTIAQFGDCSRIFCASIDIAYKESPQLQKE